MSKEELKPIDTSKYKITETGQVLKMTKEELEKEKCESEEVRKGIRIRENDGRGMKPIKCCATCIHYWNCKYKNCRSNNWEHWESKDNGQQKIKLSEVSNLLCLLF